MRAVVAGLALAAGVGAIFAASLSWGEDPIGLDQREAPPPGYSGPAFEPSYDFPAVAVAEARPWEAVDFRADPTGYMEAVLAYVLEGQDVQTWRVQDNPIRRWYHMPWMGPGAAGREFVGGITSERRSRPGELGPGQDKCRQNWAVGFYNPTGAVTMERVWRGVRSGGRPDLTDPRYAVGTVVAKLLYTQATPEEVPLLVGAPTVTANIHADPNPLDRDCPSATLSDGTPAPRSLATLRLLQVDVAVRDARADGATGWVFGTFIYDGRDQTGGPWSRLKPVGLMWGNDPDLEDGVQRPLIQGHVLSDFGIGRDFGRQGRMNGPVDNPVSACSSCHMTAQYPATASMTPPSLANWSTAKCWFRNLGPGEPFGRSPAANVECGARASTNQVSLDYSLQMAAALRNHEIIADRVTVPRFGLPFLRRRALVDETVRIDGVQTFPVTREGNED